MSDLEPFPQLFETRRPECRSHQWRRSGSLSIRAAAMRASPSGTRWLPCRRVGSGGWAYPASIHPLMHPNASPDYHSSNNRRPIAVTNVLITGATGFIGGRLALRLRDRGYAVSGFARRSARAKGLECKDIKFVAGDIRDANAVARAVKGHDVVVHLAAAYRVEAKPFHFFYDTNVEGTRNVLAASVKHEVARVIHASTTGVYGVLKELPASEDHPYGFTDHYQETKIQGERIAREAFSGPLRHRGVVVRPTGMYGPGDTRILKLVRAINRRLCSFFSRSMQELISSNLHRGCAGCV